MSDFTSMLSSFASQASKKPKKKRPAADISPDAPAKTSTTSTAATSTATTSSAKIFATGGAASLPPASLPLGACSPLPSSPVPCSPLPFKSLNFDTLHATGTFPQRFALSPPITEHDVVLLSKCKNEVNLLPSFVAHYKSLGVTALLMLDNNSTDNSMSLLTALCEQHNIKCHIFTSKEPIKTFEHVWFKALSLTYALNHWLVIADVDELLHYYSCEVTPLPVLFKIMKARKQTCLNTYLLDVYPHGSLNDAGTQADTVRDKQIYYDASVPPAQPPRAPPGKWDPFYIHHGALLKTVTPSMVRVRCDLTQKSCRDFTYVEKVSVVFVTKKTDIMAGHHRVRVCDLTTSYAADGEVYDTTDEGVDFKRYEGNVQGVVVHQLFVNVESRSRYLLDAELRERTIKVLKGGEVTLFGSGVSERVGGSRGLPYVGGKENQQFVVEEAEKINQDQRRMPSDYAECKVELHFMVVGERVDELVGGIGDRTACVRGDFFSKDRKKGLEVYGGMFEGKVKLGECVGDASGSYSTLGESEVEEIKMLFPRLKVVVAGGEAEVWKKVFGDAVLESTAPRAVLNFLGVLNVRPAPIPVAPVLPVNKLPLVKPRDHLEMIRQVSFMGIGAQKAGTSWLHKMLAGHSEVKMAREKETHFFDWHRKKGLKWYDEQWAGGATASTITTTSTTTAATTTSKQLLGEVTPCYAVLSEGRVAEIAALFPNLKVVFIARNIVERAWSAVKMELRNNVHGVKEGTFAGKEVYSNMEEANPKNYKNKYFLERLRHVDHWSRSDYSSGIRKWLKYFDKKQVLVLDFGRIETDPRGLLKEVCEFLSIDAKEVALLGDEVVGQRVNEQVKVGGGGEGGGEEAEIRPKLLGAMQEMHAPLTDEFNKLLGELGYGWQLAK